MEKTAIIIAFGLFSIFLITGFACANTVVGGKVYNSDFSEVIEGAEVTVQCGSDIKTTESIEDGTYAIAFDSETCYLDSEVEVSASKGDLSAEETGIVYESEEEDGEFVAVINLNLEEESSDSSSSSKNRGSGTWFKCGNSVCDSGESSSTCPIDCPEPEEEETSVQLITLNENSDPEATIHYETEETTNPGITGAIIGESSRKGSLPLTLGGIILLLIIAIAGISIAKNEKGKHSVPKMEDKRTMYKPLSVFY